MSALHPPGNLTIGRSDVVGYAAVYGVPTALRGGWEQIAPGAFDAALREGVNVRALFNHDPSQLLGSTAAGTLRLRSDSKGLAFELDLPDTGLANDVRALLARGDLRGMSFGFIPGAVEHGTGPAGRGLVTHRSVKQLLDVSVVTYPAYEGTTVRLRTGSRGAVAPAGLRAASLRGLDQRTQTLLIRHAALVNIHQRRRTRP